MGLDMNIYASRKGIGMKQAIEESNDMSWDDWRSLDDSEKPFCSICYWRKANHIFGWFEDNVGEVGNCEPLKLSRLNIQSLLDDCEKALSDRDNITDYFRPRNGFFFGSMEIDEYFWEQLEFTRDAMRGILEGGDVDFDSQEVWFYAWY